MTLSLPDLYFRVKDNGASVFRVVTDTRQNRMDLVQIANANVRNGEIRPQGGETPTETEAAQINAWIEKRRDELAARHLQDIDRTVDFLNQSTQWAQSKATDEELQAVSDRLLLAMHDLRTVLVRKKADKLMKDRGED
ncbi:MAG: hypothetical protein QNI90_01530 [Dinoroseobacter sp.]|nr:hypothetical protein [Dinoroseobacter sp.]MDJ0992231.1 hypothetical protein [Dinoroseobacter sp.]